VRTYTNKQWSVSQTSPLTIRIENTLPLPVSTMAKVGGAIMLSVFFLVGVVLIVLGFLSGKPVGLSLFGGFWIVTAIAVGIGIRFFSRRFDQRAAEFQFSYVDPIEIELSHSKVRHRGLDKSRRARVEEELGGYRLRLLSRKVRKRPPKDTTALGQKTLTYQDIMLENIKDPAKSIFLYGEPGRQRSQRLMDNAQRIAETTGLALIESAVPPS